MTPIQTILIANKHTWKQPEGRACIEFYIGRGSPLGNPYTSRPLNTTKAQFQCKSREESVEKYRAYLHEKIRHYPSGAISQLLDKMLLSLLDGKSIVLICFCAPNLCHGEVIREILMDRFNHHCS